MRRALYVLLFASAARLAEGCATGDRGGDLALVPDASTPAEAGAPSSPDADVRPEAEAGVDAEAGACSSDGWCTTALPAFPDPGDGGYVDPAARRAFDLRGVWVAPTREAFAVSAAGELLHWNGQAWSIAVTTGLPLSRIWGASADDLWLGGGARTVLHVTRDGGGTFRVADVSLADTGGFGSVQALAGTGANDVWVLANGLYHRVGDTWVDTSYPTSIGSLASPGDAGDAEAPTGVVITSELFELWAAPGGELWARGLQTFACDGCETVGEGLLLRRAGGVWEPVDLGAYRVAIAPTVSAAGSGSPWLCLDADCMEVARSAPEDGGLAFRSEPTTMPLYAVARAVWSSGSHAWLTSSVGQVRHYDGTAWQIGRLSATSTPVLASLHAVHGVTTATEEDVWIVGNDVALHRVGAP